MYVPIKNLVKNEYIKSIKNKQQPDYHAYITSHMRFDSKKAINYCEYRKLSGVDPALDLLAYYISRINLKVYKFEKDTPIEDHIIKFSRKFTIQDRISQPQYSGHRFEVQTSNIEFKSIATKSRRIKE